VNDRAVAEDITDIKSKMANGHDIGIEARRHGSETLLHSKSGPGWSSSPALKRTDPAGECLQRCVLASFRTVMRASSALVDQKNLTRQITSYLHFEEAVVSQGDPLCWIPAMRTALSLTVRPCAVPAFGLNLSSLG
jgi:hypothetical protein